MRKLVYVIKVLALVIFAGYDEEKLVSHDLL